MNQNKVDFLHSEIEKKILEKSQARKEQDRLRNEIDKLQNDLSSIMHERFEVGKYFQNFRKNDPKNLYFYKILKITKKEFIYLEVHNSLYEGGSFWCKKETKTKNALWMWRELRELDPEVFKHTMKTVNKRLEDLL